jgi:hypothetical protein
VGSKKGEVFLVGESMDSDEGIATANIFLSQSKQSLREHRESLKLLEKIEVKFLIQKYSLFPLFLSDLCDKKMSAAAMPSSESATPTQRQRLLPNSQLILRWSQH